MDVITPQVIAALKAAHVTATVEHVGGGLEVLCVPLSEDGSRYAWFGCGVDEDDALHWPFWNDPDLTDAWPADAVMLAFGYIWDGDEECRQTPEPFVRRVDGDPVRAVREILFDIVATPDDDYIIT